MSRGLGAHLTLETLLELSLDQLPDDQAEQVREHLLACPDCLERARSLLTLPEPPDDFYVSDEEKSVAWRELRAKLPSAGAPSGKSLAERPASAPKRPRRGSPLAFGSALAAMLALGLALGFWLRSGREGVSRGELAAAASTHLLPLDFAVLGTAPAPTRAACPPAGSSTFVWVFGGLAKKPAGGSLELRLQAPDGSRAVLPALPNSFGEVEIALERALPGEYRVEIGQVGATTDEKTYRLIVDCP